MLLAFLRPRQMLLVLDNLEHLLDATALTATILHEAPGVRVLVTSRERLREEWVFELGGLTIPSDNTRANRTLHIGLFLERARSVSTTFSSRRTTAPPSPKSAACWTACCAGWKLLFDKLTSLY